jgi:hypothetical protein
MGVNFHYMKEKKMKTLMIATAFVASLATASFADDFKANEFIVTAQSGNLELSLGTVDGQLSTIETGATIAQYTLGRFDTGVYTSIAYGRLDDTLALNLEYNLSTALTNDLTAYGTAAVSYVTATGDLGGGDVFVAPTVGLEYAVNGRVGVFGDVTYAWNASDSWTRTGGAVELGATFALTDIATITPSVVRTFDTGADATNLKLEVGFRF